MIYSCLFEVLGFNLKPYTWQSNALVLRYIFSPSTSFFIKYPRYKAQWQTHGRTSSPYWLTDQMMEPHSSCDLFSLNRDLKPLVTIVSLLNVTVISSASHLKPEVPYTHSCRSSFPSAVGTGELFQARSPTERWGDRVSSSWNMASLYWSSHTKWKNLIQRHPESFPSEKSVSLTSVIPTCFISGEILSKKIK